MTVPYVHSGYERIADDNYQTIDGRCVKALLQSWPRVSGVIVDPCAPDGSGIVDYLRDSARRDAHCRPDMGFTGRFDWIVTNPPYDRRIVDKIVAAGVDRVRSGELKGAAFLMRANWDTAKCRRTLLDDRLYRCQVRMRFRPWWSGERKARPIHSFCWHIWTNGPGEPVVRYWP